MMVADRELLTLSEWKEEETDQAHETDDLLSEGRSQLLNFFIIVAEE
jgi:hypothetical protein